MLASPAVRRILDLLAVRFGEGAAPASIAM
jgi:hypothetical protein